MIIFDLTFLKKFEVMFLLIWNKSIHFIPPPRHQ